MQISWLGQSCFQITINQNKNGPISIVIDPYDESIGLRAPNIGANIVLVSHDHSDHNNVKSLEGTPFLIDGPGEYEIQGVFIAGIPAFHDSTQGKERGRITIYTIESEEIRLCHLGDLGQKELTEEQLEQIGEIDILMIPVGGSGYTIDGKEAVKIISQIEPKIIIPMHYQISKLKHKLDGVDKFLKEMGREAEPMPKLTIKSKDLPEEDTQIVVLQP